MTSIDAPSTSDSAAAEPSGPSTAGVTPVATSRRHYSCVGRWREDVLIIDYTVEAESFTDHRPDFIDSDQSFCASAWADTAELAIQQVLRDYDPQNQPIEL